MTTTAAMNDCSKGGMSFRPSIQIMKNCFLKLFFLLVIPFMAWSCAGGDDAAERISAAETAVNEGDYSRAQSLCTPLVSEQGRKGLTETQLGQLSILYMRLSEHGDEEENIAVATQCFRDAFKMSADSLNAFFSTLQLEDQRHFVLLKRIGSSLDNPMDLSEKLAADTIPDEPQF